MYKHADMYLQEKAKLPKKQIMHSIAMARIQHNVRKVHSMIHIVQTKAHDEVVLPKVLSHENAYPNLCFLC
jgi:uncharacterized protein HemY